MSFTAHINNTVSKASKVLNFVKRNQSSCLQLTKVAAYLSLVWPTLEYATSVWDPYQLVNIKNIEKIQRRADCWVHSRYSDVKSMLQYSITSFSFISWIESLMRLPILLTFLGSCMLKIRIHGNSSPLSWNNIV